MLKNINVYYLSLLGGLFTFLFTTLGAALVFLFKKEHKQLLDISLALSAGIMLSSSFFSLIEKSLTITHNILILGLGLISGGIFITLFNLINKGKSDLLLTSITIHNIPEGLILGISFGSIINNSNNLTSSLMLTLAIAIQNFPEGCAISLPLRRKGNSRLKSFIYGSISAIVEPIFSVIGCLLVTKINHILSFMLTFAAGAMIYVITAELIPEYNKSNKKALMNICALTGFVIMMILDTCFS